MLQITGRARFVSDIHLGQESPEIAARFLAFLDDTAAAQTAALFILGDLFEYWIGDDDLDDPFNSNIIGALKRLTQSGTRSFFVAGNRDFLIGQAFAAATGSELLPEMTKLGAGEAATLLLHGDTLCTDDLPYQEFRRTVRSPQWQASFLARSLTERRQELAQLRQRSTEAMRGKTAAIMDVNTEAVRAACAAQGCHRLIHGHTHRPGLHAIGDVYGERWVLSDWGDARGDAIEMDAKGLRRLDWSR